MANPELLRSELKSKLNNRLECDSNSDVNIVMFTGTTEMDYNFSLKLDLLRDVFVRLRHRGDERERGIHFKENS